MAKKVLLLGANGQLGIDIVRAFADSDCEVTGLTRADFDADKEQPMRGLAKYSDHHYLINCIAYHKVDQCEVNPEQSFRINGAFVVGLAKFCTLNDLTLFHISTDYVFSGRKKKPYRENDKTAPLNIYGESKVLGETYLSAFARKGFVFRVSSLFGSKETGDPNINFVEKMVHAARRGDALRVIDDQIMSPTHALEVAGAIRYFIENDLSEYGIYHGCNSGSCAWFEFAQAIFDMCGLEADLSPITYTEFHSKARRPQFCSMDNSKLGEFYRMKPWREALRDYLKLKGYLREE